MIARLLAVSVLGTAITLVAAHRPAAAQNRTAKDERAKLAAAFERMNRATGGKGARVLGPIVDPDDAKLYGNIVKVWANLYDPDGFGSYKKGRDVPLTSYRWKAEQRFKFEFHSLVDVYFYLYSVEKDANGQESLRQILPKDRQTAAVLPANQSHELPIRMVFDPTTSDDVEMRFVPVANLDGKKNDLSNAVKGARTKVLGPEVDGDGKGADYVSTPPDGKGLPQPIKVRLTFQR